MDSYFTNQQLKRSSIILLGMIIVFFTGIFFILDFHYDQLKEDYIGILGSVALKITEEDPELGRKVIPLLTKGISQEEAMEGVEFLREYGLDKELQNSLFPYINKTFSTTSQIFLVTCLAMGLFLFIFHYDQQVFFYKKVRRITQGAKNIVEGKYDTFIEEDQEGDFSKLSIAFNSMGKIIHNQLEELKKEKGFLVNLLSDISHQLKTPLSSMIVYNDIMLSKDLPREQQLPFLESNQKQLERMEWLIKSLLKLARLDAQAIKFGKKNQSITKTIEESIKAIQNKAQENKVILEFNQRKEIFLEHDRPWLKEALINIIGNSIEHSPWGEKVNIKLIENPIYKRITIEDRGEGIGEEDLPNIFKRFYRAKTFQKRDSVGIGLALAKAIIEGHGGFIEAQSQLGEGTKFMITFLKY